jgi:hypothetical protein
MAASIVIQKSDQHLRGADLALKRKRVSWQKLTRVPSGEKLEPSFVEKGYTRRT